MQRRVPAAKRSVERGPQNPVITKVTMLDKIKLAAAAALVVAGVWGFYHFSDTCCAS